MSTSTDDTDWRPIEMAPKDDLKPIIAWDGNVRQWVRWLSDYEGAGWWSSESGRYFDATLWRPLSAPPKSMP